MKTFVINIEHSLFFAEDIDDAFARLGRYFTGLAEEGIDAEELFISPAHITIKPAIADNRRNPLSP